MTEDFVRAMNGKRKILLLIFLTNLLVLWANDTRALVEYTPNKKIIYPEQFHTSGSTRLVEILKILPELLYRGTQDGSLLSNYSIQLDGKDVGQSRDVVLNQTLISEIDKIEVSVSPTASEQKNGYGGVINIKLKPITQEGVSGNVLLDVDTEWDVQPTLLLNYKKDKVVVRSSLMMEYYRPMRYQDGGTENYTTGDYTARMDTIVRSYKQETAKLNVIYTPTTQDELKVQVWESCGLGKQTTDFSISEMHMEEKTEGKISFPTYSNRLWKGETSGKENKLLVEANAEYTHRFQNRGELKAQVTYTYSPQFDSSYTSQMHADDPVVIVGGNQQTWKSSWTKPHEIVGEVLTEQPLLPQESEHRLKVEVGVNGSCGIGNSYAYQETRIGKPIKDVLFDSTTIYYLSPYMEWNYEYHGWHVMLGARYQYFAREYADAATPVFSDNHTWTGNLNVIWRIREHHTLRWIGARNILRSVESNRAIVRPCYNTEMNYIFDWKDGVNTVSTGAGLQYVYAEVAQGKDRMIGANAQLFFQHGIFSMAFGGNLYHKTRYTDTEHFPGWYYNLSLAPVLNFENHWSLAGQLLYNSPIETWNATYGDAFFTQVRLTKEIKRWSISLTLSDVLNYSSYDEDRSVADEVARTTYDLYPRFIGIGAGYRF